MFFANVLKSSSGRELSLKSLFFSQMCLKDIRFTDFALHFGLSVVCLLFKASLDLHVHFCCVFTFCAVLIDVIYFFIIVKASGVLLLNGHLQKIMEISNCRLFKDLLECLVWSRKTHPALPRNLRTRMKEKLWKIFFLI